MTTQTAISNLFTLLVHLWVRFRPRTRNHWVITGCLIFVFLILPKIINTKPSEFRSSKSSGKKAPYEIFLVDPSDKNPSYGEVDYDTLPRYQTTSILNSFEVVASFNNLKPTTTYQCSIDVWDARGKPVLKDCKVNFTPQQSGHYVYGLVEPNYKHHRAGKWKATFDLHGVGKVTHRFEIARPLPHEEKKLKDHEKALEVTYRGFAHYWYGSDDGNRAMFLSSLDKSDDNPSEGLNEARFFQISGVDHEIYEYPVSEADRLNGIDYRSRSQIRFTVFRFYRPNLGWTPWFDVQRPSSEMSSILGPSLMRMFQTFMQLGNFVGAGTMAFDGQPLAYGLRYEAFRQDGNYYVINDLGHLFCNGERTRPDKVFPPDFIRKVSIGSFTRSAPESTTFLPVNQDLYGSKKRTITEIYDLLGSKYKSDDGGLPDKFSFSESRVYPQTFKVLEPLILNNMIYQPNARVASIVLKTKKTPREIAKQLGDSIRANPTPVKSQVEHTMAILRKRKI